MKTHILTLVVVAILFPLTSTAQSIFEKYSENNDVSYVSMKPKMFQMIAKMNISTNDPKAQEYINMVNSITSFKTLATENVEISKEMREWVKKTKGAFEELMEMKDKGVKVNFYVKEVKNSNHVQELLIFVNGSEGISHGGRDIRSVIVSLTGDIDLNQISKLTKKLNIPGGDKIKNKH